MSLTFVLSFYNIILKSWQLWFLLFASQFKYQPSITLGPAYSEFCYYEHPHIISKYFSSERNVSGWYQCLGSSVTTRMHSSRMRTGRSLTVCWRLLPGGGAWSWGVPGPGGRGVSALGGVPGLVGSTPGGVPGPGGSAPRGCLASQHALRQTPPSPHGQNHRCL